MRKRRRQNGPRRCGLCRQTGHNRRNCPSAGAGPSTAAIEEKQPPGDQPKLKYFVFDLETTGLSRQRNEIVDIAVKLLDGKVVLDTLVKPAVPISAGCSEAIHGISDRDVHGAPAFQQVAETLNAALEAECGDDFKAVLVAYNGHTFDVPFLLSCYERVAVRLSPVVAYSLDPLPLCRQVFGQMGNVVPENFRLGTIYKSVTGREIDGAHRAAPDVDALIAVVKHPPIWRLRATAFKDVVSAERVPLSLSDDEAEEEDDDARGAHWTALVTHELEAECASATCTRKGGGYKMCRKCPRDLHFNCSDICRVCGGGGSDARCRETAKAPQVRPRES